MKNVIKFSLLFSCALIVTSGVFYAYWILVASKYPDLEESGQFGDTFGALNVLFSSLAFAAVSYSIFHQHSALRQTTEEMNKASRLSALSTLAGTYAGALRAMAASGVDSAEIERVRILHEQVIRETAQLCGLESLSVGTNLGIWQSADIFPLSRDCSGIVQGALEVVRHFRVSVKEHLLIDNLQSIHDLRVFALNRGEPELRFPRSENPAHITGEYYWSKHLKLFPIQILNASDSSPAMLSCHLLIDWLGAEGGGRGISTHRQMTIQGHCCEVNFLKHDKGDKQAMIDLPTLYKGRVQTVRFEDSCSIYFGELEDWAEATQAYEHGDTIVAKVPEPLALKAKVALNSFVQFSRIQLLVVLDNEEVLPFLWDRGKLQFKPGVRKVRI